MLNRAATYQNRSYIDYELVAADISPHWGSCVGWLDAEWNGHKKGTLAIVVFNCLPDFTVLVEIKGANMRIKLYPGSMGMAAWAIDLFGINRVDVGTWMSPVYVNDVSEEELEIAKTLLDIESKKFNFDIVPCAEKCAKGE